VYAEVVAVEGVRVVGLGVEDYELDGHGGTVIHRRWIGEGSPWKPVVTGATVAA
jgi:hypothetical protein